MNVSNTPFAPLSAHLLDLLDAIKDQTMTLTIVGGFGLFLRRQLREEQGETTLIERVPEARATEDFDVLLQLELLADAPRMQALHSALTALGYTASTPMFQFVKEGTAQEGRRSVKVDLLAPEPEVSDPILSVKYPRVKAKASPLHARITPEAIAYEEDPLDVPLEGLGSDGRPLDGGVRLPNVYTLLVMKLHAFRDEYDNRKGGDRTLYAAKHVQDLFTLVALLTKQENDALPRLRNTYNAHAAAREAAAIVARLFATDQAQGSLRLREVLGTALSGEDLTTFLDVIQETFSLT